MTPFAEAAPPPGPVALLRDAQEAEAALETLVEDFARESSARDLERRLPWAELERFTASGLWAASVPKAYGGAGIGAGEIARITARISEADGSLGQIPQNHFQALEVLRIGGSETQKRFFYGRVLAGERLGNALAEIGAKDFQRRTRLTRDPGGWRVAGRKFYCTGAIFAHWIPTLVVAEEEGVDRSRLVFIPRTAPGVSIVDDWDGFGQRTTGSGSVIFENVAVEPEWVVPFQESLEKPTTLGPHAQILHAAIDLGIGRAACAATLEALKDRPEDPLASHRLGEVGLRLAAASAALDHAGEVLEAAQKAPDEASVAQASLAVAGARALTTRSGLLAANALFEFGDPAARFAENLDRHWRNVRTHTLHDPVRWKYHIVGNHRLNGRLPPRHSAI